MRMTNAEFSAYTRSARRAAIIDGALRVAKRDGVAGVLQRTVAVEAGVAKGTITHEFGSMSALWDAIMEEAVARYVPEIIAWGLSTGNPIAKRAPPALREAAALSIR